VKRKLEAIITVQAIPGIEFPAEVSEVSQTAGEGTLPGTGMPSGERKFAAYVQIKDRKQAPLRPGMTARVQVIVERLEEVVSVPHECVFQREERMVVFVRAGEGFKEVTVELGEENDKAVVVTKGLTGGEEVALRDVEASEIGAPEEMPGGSADATGVGL
jgi:multidrug efflux pump subunit AcrA (membrane-fusion protein)